MIPGFLHLCRLLAMGDLFVAGRAAPVPALAEVPADRLAPGLVATYRSTAGAPVDGVVARVEAKPAITFQPGPGAAESLLPDLPPGPFEIEWSGLIEIRESGAVRWSAFAAGEVEVRVGDRVVLRAAGSDPAKRWVGESSHAFSPGQHRFAVRYRSAKPDGISRLQVGWEGEDFASEPLPAWRLHHLVAEVPPALAAANSMERGRSVALTFGCGQCHREAFPELPSLPPGPSLHDAGRRVSTEWLVRWLMEPSVRTNGASMPRLFAPTAEGLAEAQLVASVLVRDTGGARAATPPVPDHRSGRNSFLGIGCFACHLVPDLDPGSQSTLVPRTALADLAERFNVDQLSEFLLQPGQRYPDGRMPVQVTQPGTARELAAYLLTYAGRSTNGGTAAVPGGASDAGATRAVLARLGVEDSAIAGRRLMEQKGCAACHAGLALPAPTAVAVRRTDAGCLSGTAGPRFPLNAAERESLGMLLARPAAQRRPAPFAERRWQFERAGCARCHARDSESASPLEVIGRDLWTSHIARLPYQRTPSLSHALSKYRVGHATGVVRDGVKGVRPSWYSYRMPAYGPAAERLVRAMAEADGELLTEAVEEPEPGADALVTPGLALTGFEGYGCVSCHLWKGRNLAEPDPSAVGPDLASAARRVRRDWFNRWVEDPQRVHPGTPMPSFFPRNAAPSQREILGGDPVRQKAALWEYLRKADTAPSPEPRPSEPIDPLPAGRGPLVAQIPVEVPGRGFMEGIAILSAEHDLVVYDVGAGAIRHVFTGASILRNPNGNRSFVAEGASLPSTTNGTWGLLTTVGREEASEVRFREYERRADDVRLSARLRFASGWVDVNQTLKLPKAGERRELRIEMRVDSVPGGGRVEPPVFVSGSRWRVGTEVVDGAAARPTLENGTTGVLSWELPAAAIPASRTSARRTDWVPSGDREAGDSTALVRPGYRARRFAMPKTRNGEDLLMPGAIAVDPRTDRLFVASLKQGQLFTLDESADGKGEAVFRDYAGGLYQDAWAMQHDGTALHVLHRRNLTRVRDGDGDGYADRFERVAALPHAIANAYDWGYGLIREPAGTFLLTLAPHANQRLKGSGSLLRFTPDADGGRFDELAWGYRNPLGWCTGPDGQVFFTDNQGEWVATSKLGHHVEGSYNGYPNASQLQHTNHPFAPTAVWVPYDWARSINGVTMDGTAGRFGPFAGQLFMAELMNGGAIIRANVESVGGVYQGACFPFWGKGLVGPLVLAFDTQGRLYVGSITMPGWMGQPDRGAVFRIEPTGEVPFEMQSIHIRPRGFRVRFTRPLDGAAAARSTAWRIEHYRYEYTGAYGSPELDRRALAVERVEMAPDGLAADLTTTPLERGRVYAIQCIDVRSREGERPLHPTGVYTVNEVP